jgi:putative ABC transport system permease protein
MFKSVKVAALLAFSSLRKGNPGVIFLIITILTVISVNSLFVPGLLQGLVSGANTQLRNTYSSDIVVTSGSIQPLLSNATELTNQIAGIDGVSAVTYRNAMGAEFIYGNNHCEATVYGVQPDAEQQVFTIDHAMIEGTYLAPGDSNQIVLGIQVAGADRPNLELYARSLQNAHAGDTIILSYGGVKKPYIVKGIFYTEFLQTDFEAFITQNEMESVNPGVKDTAATIHVKVKSDAVLPVVMDKINNLQSGLKVLKWQEYAGIVSSLTESFSIINLIMNIINLLVVGITVFIVTYIDVVNRRKQIGVQRAIGITPGSITLSYLMRAVFYAFIALGCAILLFYFAVVPIETQYPFHFPFGAVYLSIGPVDLMRMFAIVLSVSLVASYLPVRGVMKMKIMDAIWG